jgi:hypothetical protein
VLSVFCTTYLFITVFISTPPEVSDVVCRRLVVIQMHRMKVVIMIETDSV